MVEKPNAQPPGKVVGPPDKPILPLEDKPAKAKLTERVKTAKLRAFTVVYDTEREGFRLAALHVEGGKIKDADFTLASDYNGCVAKLGYAMLPLYKDLRVDL